jgi:hypothetical protein
LPCGPDECGWRWAIVAAAPEGRYWNFGNRVFAVSEGPGGGLPPAPPSRPAKARLPISQFRAAAGSAIVWCPRSIASADDEAEENCSTGLEQQPQVE